MVRGDLAQAAANYKAALRLAPHLTSCWCNLGNAHHKAGKPQEAIAYYLQALKLNPGHWPSRTNLVQALIATKQYIIARGLLLELIDERPQDGALRHQLGKVHFELEEPEAAIARFEQAIALDPRDAESLYWIGGIKQRAGDNRGRPGGLCRSGPDTAPDQAAGCEGRPRIFESSRSMARSPATRRPNISSRMLTTTPIRFRCSPPTSTTSKPSNWT